MLSYNELVGNTEQSAILGRALNTVRCPSCGAHTVYLNDYGDEWCFSCEWFEWGEESYQGKSPALVAYQDKLAEVTLKCARDFNYPRRMVDEVNGPPIPKKTNQRKLRKKARRMR